MPLPTLDPFIDYHTRHFHIGGEPWSIRGVANSWRDFSGILADVAGNMRGADDCQFQGSEAEAFHAQLYEFVPSRLDIAKEAHEGLATALDTYATDLEDALADMSLLEFMARGHHAAVNLKVGEYNATEEALALAAATANPAVGMLQVKLAKDYEEYMVLLKIWKDDLENARRIKEKLREDINAVVASITGLETSVSFADRPQPGAISSYVHLHIESLANLGWQLQGLSGRIEDSLGLLVELVGADDVAGERVVNAVADFISDWSPSRINLIQAVKELGQVAVRVAELYKTLDDESAEKLAQFNGYIRSLDWGILDEDDYDVAELTFLGLPRPTVFEEEKSLSSNFYGSDEKTETGDLVRRDRKGDIDFVTLSRRDGRGQVEEGVDGIWYVKTGDRTTEYYPLAPPGSYKGTQLVSKTHDLKTGIVKKEYKRADGSVYTQTMLQSTSNYNGEVYKKNIGISTLEQTPEVRHYYQPDGTTTTVIQHRDTKTMDIIKGDATPVHVDHEGKILNIGTRDNPLEGPAATTHYREPIIVGLEPREVPGYALPIDQGTGEPIKFPNIGFATSRVSEVGTAVTTEMDPSTNKILAYKNWGVDTGRHHLHTTRPTGLPIEAEHLKKFGTVARRTGTVGNLYSFGVGGYESVATGDPVPIIKSIGGIAGGAAGGYVGAAAATALIPGVGWIGSAAIIASAVTLGYWGGKAGEQGGEWVGERINDTLD